MRDSRPVRPTLKYPSPGFAFFGFVARQRHFCGSGCGSRFSRPRVSGFGADATPGALNGVKSGDSIGGGRVIGARSGGGISMENGENLTGFGTPRGFETGLAAGRIAGISAGRAATFGATSTRAAGCASGFGLVS